MTHAPILLATSLPKSDEDILRAMLADALPHETLLTPDTCADRAAVEIAIVANPPAGALRDLPNLRFIHSLWAGVEGLLADDTVPDVPITRLIDPALAQAMAEAVAAAALFLHRDFPRYATQQAQGAWRPHQVLPASERIVTLLGLGEMGRASAHTLQAIGFSVRGWSRSPATLPGVSTYAGPDGLAAALDGANILVNLLPLTPATRGILGAATFARLAPGAGLVNFGRGGHLVERDLADALANGRLAHAVLDVFEREPLPPTHPLWTLPGVTILPHVAAPTTKTTAAAIVADAVTAFRASGRIPPAVDRGRGY